MRFQNIPVKCAQQQRQRGAVLLLMMLIMIVGGAFLFTGNFGSAAKDIENGKQTIEALSRAKQALLGYAAADTVGAHRGTLPCPDFNNDGLITVGGPLPARDYTGSNCRTNVGGIVQPGWFPWRTLDTSELRDGNGDQLWYVVFDDFHANGTVALNSDTPSAMSVDGIANIVAIVFSPGSPQLGQNSRAITNALTAVSSYLDGANADGDLAFISTGAGVNDRLMTITRDELMRVVERRILREAKICLDAYAPGAPGNTKYPWAAQINGGVPPDYAGDFGTTFGRIPANGSVNRDQVLGTPDATMAANWPAGCFNYVAGSFWNDWRELLFLQIAPGFQPGSGGVCGACVTLDANNAARAVILTPGRILGAQLRGTSAEKGTIGNYFEGTNDGTDLIYTDPPQSATTNDRAICIDGVIACR